MAITYASNVFTVSGACTQTDLQTAIDANTSNGMYEAGGCVFKAASLTFSSGASLSINDGTTLVFDDAGAYRVNLVSGTSINFNYGGGIVYNGNVQHSFFNGSISGSNIVYRLNGSGSGRSDFFSNSASSSGGLTNLTLVIGGSVTGYSFYSHLGPFAGKITGLKLINDMRSTGATWNLNFGAGTYASVTFPSLTSTYGLTTGRVVYLGDSASNSKLTSPTIPGTSMALAAGTVGTAELIDETWSDLTTGTVGTLSYAFGTGTTTVSRKITWTPGTYVGWNVYLADSQSTPTVYQSGLLSSSTGVLLKWQVFVSSSSATTTTLSPFRITARKLGYVEQYKTFSPVQPITELFIPVVDAYYTSSQSALTNIAANSSTKVLTLSTGATLTLDQINDWFDYWLSLSAQLAAVPQTPKSNSGTVCTLTAWSVSIANTVSAGTKLKTLAAPVSLTSSADITGLGITGNVTQATPTNLTGVTITGNLTFNTNTPITVTLTNCTVTGTVSNSGSATVTITKVNTTLGTVGANVVAQQFATISAPNLLSGSRVRVYDEDNAVELFNGVLASSGFSQSFVYTADTIVTLTATYTSGATAKLGVSTTGVFTATGVSFLNSQEDDTVYNGYAIDGSLVTGFSADYAQDDVNLTMATNFTAANLYAWWIYTLTTEDGICHFFGGITALDAANLQINTSIVSIFLDNSTALFIYQTDAVRLFRSDGSYPAKTVTTGGGGIQVNWNSNVYVGTANVPSSAQNATATIAAMNAAPPNVNVAKMNGATVLGTGVSNDLWRG